MINVSKIEVYGWEAAIRGARNPMNSWAKSDSEFCHGDYTIGEADQDLMMRLRNAGPDHRKFMRMIVLTMDIEASLFWWKEFDTYKVATVRNSCSTMHKIHTQEITHESFGWVKEESSNVQKIVVSECELLRRRFLNETDPITKEKYWRDLIELLPSSYIQKATVQLNYETLLSMYKNRKNHKLAEWVYLCKVLEVLPMSKLITGEKDDVLRNVK